MDTTYIIYVALLVVGVVFGFFLRKHYLERKTESANEFAAANASVITLAVLNFNRGLRAYYFGLAVLSWFIHPVLFALATLWVVAVLYRREFMSKTLDCLSNVPVPEDFEKK